MTTGITPPSGGFGAYVALSTATSAQNKTDVNANLDRVIALLQQEGTNNAPVYPEFAIIPQVAASLLIGELTALKTVITNSP